MYDSDVDQYFELALDLPERERAKLLDRLDSEQPDTARQVRALLTNGAANMDFACRAGISVTGERPGSTLDTLDHMAVQVADIARAITWYRARFQFDVAYQDETWALLRFANVGLALVLPGQHPPHLAVCRDDAAVFGKLQPHRDGTRSVYIEDPWGNAVEVLDSASMPTT